MTSVFKYRRWSLIAVAVLVVIWLTTMAAIWNSLLSVKDAKNEGWIIFFMCLMLFTACVLFYLAYINTDSKKLEKLSSDAFEAGKNKILSELEASKKMDADQHVDDLKNEKTIEAVLSSVHGARSLSSFCSKLMTAVAREFEFVQAVMFARDKKESVFNPVAEYALTDRKPQSFKEGDNLNGQVALNKAMSIIYDVPENYFVISSGLGSSQPNYLIIAPVVVNDQTIAVLEMAAFKKPDEQTGKMLEKIMNEVGNKLHKFITD